jgi:hypothetical protein
MRQLALYVNKGFSKRFWLWFFINVQDFWASATTIRICYGTKQTAYVEDINAADDTGSEAPDRTAVVVRLPAKAPLSLSMALPMLSRRECFDEDCEEAGSSEDMATSWLQAPR